MTWRQTHWVQGPLLGLSNLKDPDQAVLLMSFLQAMALGLINCILHKIIQVQFLITNILDLKVVVMPMPGISKMTLLLWRTVLLEILKHWWLMMLTLQKDVGIHLHQELEVSSIQINHVRFLLANCIYQECGPLEKWLAKMIEKFSSGPQFEN